ncbi:MAG: electron transfer flavoprotein subunit alpha/FixB family protein [Proteobacteria bacterium]|nr:electron transfer flavoprotein subunit alpha/FixB family protein [Pseudomonadota bacterium]
MGNILVVAEIQKGELREASYELLTQAHAVAGAGDAGRKVRSLVIGSGVADAAAEFAGKGGGDTYLADAEGLAAYNVNGWEAAILAAAEAAEADLILLSNTPSGWDVAPRIAAALDAAFVSDCFKIEADGDGLALYRRVFNGKLDAKLSVSGAGPVVATMQPGACAAYEGTSQGATHPVEVKLDGAKAVFVEVKAAESKGVDLTKADIIVSGGRGVGDPEKFTEVIQPLADALGGAMGASRPVVDAGWLPHEYQVGSSGQVVQPKLYIACGISGALQHLVGMKTSNVIVAINTDPDAPIFEVADIGIVADLFEVVPALTKAIQEAKGG